MSTLWRDTFIASGVTILGAAAGALMASYQEKAWTLLFAATAAFVNALLISWNSKP
jgi:hypothetical protein